VVIRCVHMIDLMCMELLSAWSTKSDLLYAAKYLIILDLSIYYNALCYLQSEIRVNFR
jgi:hypothetical protein